MAGACAGIKSVDQGQGYASFGANPCRQQSRLAAGTASCHVTLHGSMLQQMAHASHEEQSLARVSILQPLTLATSCARQTAIRDARDHDAQQWRFCCTACSQDDNMGTPKQICGAMAMVTCLFWGKRTARYASTQTTWLRCRWRKHTCYTRRLQQLQHVSAVWHRKTSLRSAFAAWHLAAKEITAALAATGGNKLSPQHVQGSGRLHGMAGDAGMATVLLQQIEHLQDLLVQSQQEVAMWQHHCDSSDSARQQLEQQVCTAQTTLCLI